MFAVIGVAGLGAVAATAVVLHEAGHKTTPATTQGPQNPGTPAASSGPGGGGGGGGGGGIPQGPSGPTTVAGLNPSKFQAFGRTHYYQIPSNAKGLVVFFPGCARFPYGFWPKSATSPECCGMPEDVSHTKQALRKGYAVLVLTPMLQTGKYAGCWSMSGGVGDYPQVQSIVSSFIQQHGFKGKPLYVIGASSGGGLIQNLARKVIFPISGVVSEVESHQGIPPKGSPPTVFVVMERDSKALVEAPQHVSEYQKIGIPAAWVMSPKRVVYPTFFSDLIVTVTPTQSQAAVASLKTSGILDAAGNILYDPHDDTKRSKWLTPLTKIMSFSMSFNTNTVLQAMLFAYAEHEHVANYTTAALTWFEGGCKQNFNTLVSTLSVDKPASF